MGRFRRVVTDVPVQCPAGEYVGETPGGTACRCRITKDTIDSVSEPTTLNRWCFGDYSTCPTWRADKEAHWASRSNRDLLGGDGNYRVADDFERQRAALAEERREAPELDLTGNLDLG